MNKKYNETQENKQAELEAQSDTTVAEELENQKKILDELTLKVELSKEYRYNGETYTSIDLEGLKDLTTRDAQYFDNVLEKAGHHPTQKFKDTFFTKHVAMRVTGLDVEFFDQLRWLDMNEITNMIFIFFRYGLVLAKK